jgi:hypothetical protein
MYCENCYADVTGAPEGKCPKCGRGFDPAKPRTFLARPFPSIPLVIIQVVGTTLLAIGAAWAVAFHQMARTSGH